LKSGIKLIALVLSSLIFLTACIPGGGSYSAVSPAGIFSGIWHGWIAPVSLVISIFRDNVSIYEANNTGFWYDFGFYVAILGGFGGFSLARRKHKD
jgi:O-antigen/teichoic acid export membrane protein